nr:MAG TPA: hypothetical protein [Caudoviricetes sp.]
MARTTIILILKLTFNTASCTLRGKMAKDTSLFLADAVFHIQG